MGIGKRIKRVRTQKGIKQTFVAGKLGKEPGWLSNIESERRSISADDLGKIAEVLGVDVGIFFADEIHETCKNDDHAATLDLDPTGTE